MTQGPACIATARTTAAACAPNNAPAATATAITVTSVLGSAATPTATQPSASLSGMEENVNGHIFCSFAFQSLCFLQNTPSALIMMMTAAIEADASMGQRGSFVS